MNRSRAVLLLAALVVVSVTLRLGLWQLDRAAQKESRQRVLDERQALPPLAHADLPATTAAVEAVVSRSVALQGTWLPTHTVYLENRPMKGRPGFFVLTPLQLDDGTSVLVQRGWTPREVSDRTRVIEPPTPAGAVTLSGRMATSPGRLYEFQSAEQGRIRQNVDIASYAAETGLKLRPFSVVLMEPARTLTGVQEDGLLREWAQPASDVHKHYGYAFQWFALATLTLILYVWFQIVRPWRSRTQATIG